MNDEITKQRLKEIANRYSEFTIDLAKMATKLGEIHNSCEFMSNETKDNGDPVILAEEALAKIGELLGTVVIYAEDYRNEAEDKLKN